MKEEHNATSFFLLYSSWCTGSHPEMPFAVATAENLAVDCSKTYEKKTKNQPWSQVKIKKEEK